MKIDIRGTVAMLDRRTTTEIAAACERLFGRARERIAGLDLHFDHVTRTGATVCDVTVRTGDHLQVLARHRDQDALTAALTALERARLRLRRALTASRKSIGRPLPRQYSG